MTTPKLSVIIPTYNWSSVLPYSVGSVLRQTFADFELLVVGDGCTDDSEAVVKALGDARVRWINLPENTGHQSAPNNEGLRQARGEFIAYLGHDDLWFPHHLSNLVTALDAGADLAFAVTLIVGPQDSFRVPAPFQLKYSSGMWIPPTGIAHRRNVTEHVGGWRHYRELETDPEVDLWQRAYEGGHEFTFAPRLSAVKFSAAERRNVYRDRPHHEQAAWFARITNEPDLEAAELAKMLAQARRLQPWSEKLFTEMLRGFLSETAARLRKRLFRRRQPNAKLPLGKGEALDRRRQFKGLEPKP